MDRTKDLKIKQQSYAHLILDKGNVLWKNIAISTNDAGKTGFLTAEE